MTKKFRILLAEDDPNFGSILKSYLELNDYEVVLKADGRQGLSAFYDQTFDLCILDIMMPEMDGFTLAKEIRKHNDNIPLIFLTAKTLKEDILEGFRIGADDYLTKPFDSEVLLYKIQAILKRHATEKETLEEPVFTIGKFTFHTRLRTLESEKQSFILSPKEADLLKLFCSSPDGILSRKTALTKIWGQEDYFTARSMDVFLSRLRKYFKSDTDIEILNIHGNGFRMICHRNKK
ncbi:MAG: response regulator transcription factor [Bacteroidota bacterium]|nr:response regulator transcription factor [Bacteroidota bacterium]